MPIVGFGFDKINIEKKEQFTKEDKINNNIRVESLKEFKIKTSDKEESDAILMTFEFGLDYGKAGNLELKGHIIFYDNEEKVKELLESWTKNKKLPPDFGTYIFNFIMLKSNVKALELEEEVGLPLHLKLPRFKIKA